MIQTVIVPEAWEDIKLEKYLAYTKALKPYEGTDDYEQTMYEKAMNHFCNLNTDTIRKLPMENYNAIMDLLRVLFAQGSEIPVVKKFTIGSTDFGFIPNLDSMTYGEYLDLTTYSKDLWNNLPTFLSIIYRPIVKKKDDTYEVETYNGTNDDLIELFKHALTMDIVWGAIGFFTVLQTDLLNGTLNYSLERMKKALESSVVQETLKASGVDTSALLSSVTTTLPSSKLSQK